MPPTESLLLQWLIKATLWGLCLWTGAWILRHVNPRWRAWLWRAGGVGLLVLAALACVPPLLNWQVAIPVAVVSPQSDIEHSEPPINDHANEVFPAIDDAEIRRPEVGTWQHDLSVPPWPETQIPDDVDDATLLTSPATDTASSLSAESAPTLVAPRDAAETAPHRPAWSEIVSALLVTVWGVGMLAFSVQWLIGVIRLRSWYRAAVPASPNVLQETQLLASRLKILLPEVRISNRVTVPAVFGCWRPRVLLPRDFADTEASPFELRASLAHELSHIASRDLIWDRLLQLWQTLLWWHPCFFKMVAVHRAACEQVGDLKAAELLGDRLGYRAFLARVALRTLGQRPCPGGMAMASRPEILERLATLASGLQARALGRRGLMAAGICGLLLITIGLVSIGLRTVEAAPPMAGSDHAESVTAESNDATAESASEQLAVATDEASPAKLELEPFELTVLKAEDDSPLAGVEVRFLRPRDNLTYTTDAEGKLSFPWPLNDDKTALSFRRFEFRANAPGRVQYVVEMGELPPESLPRSKTIRMRTGVPIGGVIVDERGNPVEGARLFIYILGDESIGTMHYPILDQTTGADGRWHLEAAPEPVDTLSLRMRHPDFVNQYLPVQAATDGRYQLQRGFNIAGTVTGPDGEPIKGATVVVGSSRFSSDTPQATTDADGQYRLTALPVTNTQLTVTSQKFAPQTRPVVAHEGTVTEDFQLEPGQAITFRVVDTAGEPLRGVRVATDTWRGGRAVAWEGYTTAHGEVTWSGAPNDAVKYDLLHRGYITVRDISLTPRDEPYVITIHPQRTFDISVVDSETGEDISEIVATFGTRYPDQDKFNWRSFNLAKGNHGHVRLAQDEPYDPLYIRVTADGYEPWISEELTDSPVQTSLEARMKRGQGLSGTVLTQGGEPAADALVTLVTSDEAVQFGSDYRPFGGAATVHSDRQGRFQLPANELGPEQSLLVFVHPEGYRELPATELSVDEPVTLEPWSRVEVTLFDGEQPVPEATIQYQPARIQSNKVNVNILWHGITTKTDQHGKATLDRVVPKEGAVGHQIEIRYPNGSMTTTLQRSQKLEPVPGETYHATLGGTGRAVTGRIFTPPDPPLPHRWDCNGFGNIQTVSYRYGDEQYRFNRFIVQSDGRFRIPDLPAGEYRLDIKLTAVPEDQLCGGGHDIGKVTHTFTVTEGEGELDLGELPAEWNPYLRAGQPVPEFAAWDQHMNMVRTGDFRGRLLVLDFWATWCGPCVAEMRLLAELSAAYENDSRIEFVGVALEQNLEIASQFAAARGLHWRQISGQGLGHPLPNSFNVQAIPAKFLIGPDGAVLYRGSDIQELKQAIGAALRALPAEQAATRKPPTVRATPIEDPFATDGLQATMAISQGTPRYIVQGDQPDSSFELVAHDGSVVRHLPLLVPYTRLGMQNQGAIDHVRERVYVCNQQHSNKRMLTALTREGRQLFEIELPELEAVTVDGRTGDIWCLISPSLDEGFIAVLDAEGTLRATYPHRGFALRYSEAADGFWLVGKQAQRIGRDGQVRASTELPSEVSILSAVTPDSAGGCWVIEWGLRTHAGSGSRLWHFAPDASTLARVDFPTTDNEPPGEFPTWVEGVGDTAWVGIKRVTSNQADDAEHFVRRFSSAGKMIDELPIAVLSAARSADGQSLWLLTDNELQQWDADGKLLQGTPHSSAALSREQLLWLGAFE